MHVQHGVGSSMHGFGIGINVNVDLLVRINAQSAIEEYLIILQYAKQIGLLLR